MRPIDADALKEILRYKLIEFVKHPTFVRSDMEEGIDRGISCALMAINDAPTIQPDAPRVMTLKEVLRSSQKIGVPCWVEDHIEGIGVVLFPAVVTSDDIYIQYTGNDYYEGAIYHWAYNKRLRCWTAKPTDEQRKAVKWDA
jgi:hypothetical protein